jgi:translation initiation factor IF-2
LKIRIFTLAKELNVDSKVLIGYCQKVGIHLKDSALASISEEEKELVLAYMKQAATKAEAAKAEVPAPARPLASKVASSRVPQMRAAGPKPAPPREPAPKPEPVAGAVAAEEAALAPTSEATPVIAAVAAEEAAPAGPAPVDLEPPTEEQRPEGSPEPPSAPAEASPPLRPLRREDYLPASGTTRTMVSRPNVSQLSTSGPRKPKVRPSPQLPKLAEPPPPPKTAVAAPAAVTPAQKPEMRLSKEMLEEKPLHEHIRAHAEEKKRRLKGDELEDVASPGGKRPGAARVGRAAAGMGLLSGRKQRQENRARGGAIVADEEEETGRAVPIKPIRSRSRRGTAVQLPSVAEIDLPVTVRSLSEAMGRRAVELLRILASRGQMLTINSALAEEDALELAVECGVDLRIRRPRDIEEELLRSATSAAESSVRAARPPIVTILGHVDHGKTTLLDKIRSANVAAGEAGGITQHIAAYQIDHGGRKITFVDTPGHAAFAEMRARGANVTDVAVLVVAANDGVMPQTVEALNHARAANVPVVVALNKIDLPDRNEQRVLQELAAQNLLAAEWGGDTEVVRTSGVSGAGIDELLETLLTVAELRELTADASRAAHGVCLEAFRDEGRGALAWLIVQDGTLRKGDVVLCGSAFGRIRSMYDDHDREVEQAPPSTPVKVAGLDVVPWAGDRFFVLSDVEEARRIATLRRERGREQQLAQRGKLRTLQDILTAGPAGEVQELPVILKADTPGSLEALKGELLKFQHPEVRVKILHDGVGGVNESDVYLASASGAIVVAFHVVAEDAAAEVAKRDGVEIRSYNIIYEVTEDIRKALEGLLKPQTVESRTGRAIVLQTFDISRFGRVAGCRVLNGVIERSNRIRLVRDQRIMNEYNIASLKRNKDDAREVREGLECGIRLEGFDDVKEGDIFEAFKVEEIKRTL